VIPVDHALRLLRRLLRTDLEVDDSTLLERVASGWLMLEVGDLDLEDRATMLRIYSGEKVDVDLVDSLVLRSDHDYAIETLRRVVADAAPCDEPDCSCSLGRARRFLDRIGAT
jgi:hypothetical protein